MRRTTLTYDVPVGVAFAYLSDPRNRPEWQSSLKRVELLDDGVPRTGQRWLDHTAVGLSPEMVVTEMETDRVWSETGRWRGIEADLELGFAPVDGGVRCRVEASFEVRGAGLLRPVGWAATGAGLFAVRSDLAKAGRILAEREH